MYENFEARYGYFSKLAKKMQQEMLRTGAILDEWKSLGLPLDEPFSERVLREQFEMVTNSR